MSDQRATIPEHDAMDVINRVLSEVQDIDRIVIICQNIDGSGIYQYSNARSSAELYGMQGLAMQMSQARDTD